jgi:hypothetical protein
MKNLQNFYSYFTVYLEFFFRKLKLSEVKHFSNLRKKSNETLLVVANECKYYIVALITIEF